MLGSGAGGTTSLTRNVMQGARDCHSTRRRSAGNAGRVPRRTCAQCGGMWGTRLDAQVSPGANLEGAVLEISPGQEGWRGPRKRAAIALRSGRIAPLINSHIGLFWPKSCTEYISEPVLALPEHPKALPALYQSWAARWSKKSRSKTLRFKYMVPNVPSKGPGRGRRTRHF